MKGRKTQQEQGKNIQQKGSGEKNHGVH
jgi:hypothetical protein